MQPAPATQCLGVCMVVALGGQLMLGGLGVRWGAVQDTGSSVRLVS